MAEEAAVMTDLDLLREYGERGSEDAFATLVRQYVDLVYSAALRQINDPGKAEETTQAVFIILARKASRMPAHTMLGGWLLRTTRFVTANARRRELHRMKTEQEAVNLHQSESDSNWSRIAPVLDEALVRLNEQDRAVVAMRFFEDKSFKEIGQAMGMSDDVAHKRVSRAVEKLRSEFARRGVVLPAAVITAALVADAVHAAPGALAPSVSAAIFSKGTSPAAELADYILAAFQFARINQIILRTTVVGMLTLAAWMAVHQLNANSPARTQIAAVPPTPNRVTIATTAPVVSAPVDVETTNAKAMRFQVLDAESQLPVPKARLTLEWVGDSPFRMTNFATTDQAGTALLSLKGTPISGWEYRIEIYRDGYVPKYVSWSEIQGDNFDQIPSECTTRLMHGVNIGGMVVNESHEPVSGARVVFNVLNPSQTVERERLTMGQHYHVETTGEDGRWRCNHVPEQFGGINFKVLHSEYAPQSFGSAPLGQTAYNGMTHLATAELRSEAAVMTLHHGTVAGGLVVDESGNPVAGAKVTFNQEFWEPTANRITGDDGKFRFAKWDPLESTCRHASLSIL